MRRAPFLALLLAGCTTVPSTPGDPAPPPPPQPEPVACVDPAQIPEEPPTVGQKFNGDAKHDLQILAPNAQALRKWGQDLKALLDGCAAGQPAPQSSVAAPPAAP